MLTAESISKNTNAGLVGPAIPVHHRARTACF